MNRVDQRPSAPGQLVWSPADPTMGVGLVIDVEGPRVRVRLRAQIRSEPHSIRVKSVRAPVLD